MTRGRGIAGTIRVLAVAALLISLLPSPAARAQATPTPGTPAPPDPTLLGQLQRQTAGTVEIATHAETGLVRFIGTAPGQPVPRIAQVSPAAPSETAARAFLSRYSTLFGIGDQGKELTVKRERALPDGRGVLKFSQQYEGIPVFGGELIVHLDAARNLRAAIGEVLPNIAVDASPRVDAAAAAETARQATSKEHGVPLALLNAGTPELHIFNRALLDEPGPRTTHLVWQVEVRPQDLRAIRQLVLVDAHAGGVELSFNQVPDAKVRRTYTANQGSGLPGTLVCDESNPTCSNGDTDAQDAHRYAGDTYDFYQTRHGRDSINGSGLAIQSTVHWNNGVDCPNAFWDGVQMVYCDGLAKDDIVGHELTHGVTDYESNLIYLNQSGAINESLSDVWGELVDQVNGSGNDAANVRWLIGEDASIGVIRNMANPPAMNDPDRMTSPLFYLGSGDNGGVHINSGVNNKAAFLMVDGGTFNGRTVTALGVDKTVAVYYEAQTNLLTSSANYADLYNALQQACTNVIGTAGITAGDCTQVTNAVQAVEMNQPGGPPPPMLNGLMCPTGQIPVDVFYDSLESPASGNWATAFTIGANQWSYPPALADVNATSGSVNFFGNDPATRTDSTIARTADLTIPAGARLRFNHAHTFEGTTTHYDGGVLEYSTNGGGSWTSPSSGMFMHGGYTGVISSSYQNPLGGQSAWGGTQAFRSSQVDLASLAGQSVRFRFRIGTDTSVGARGWFIDDVRIYTCAAGSPAIVVNPVSGLVTTESGGTASFTVRLSSAPTGSSNVILGLGSSNTNEGTVSPASLTFTPLNALTAQTVTVTGVNDTAVDGNTAYTIITTPAVSGDSTFNGLNPPDVSVTNQDNESPVTPGISVSPSSGLVTTEAGGQASFQVALTSVPSASVTIGLSSSDTSEGTVSPSSLTFTTANALTPQTVTVTGVEDTALDGDVAYAIVTQPATSTDSNYANRNAADVTVTNQDNECSSPTMAAVPNGQGGLTVTLSTAPRAMSQVLFRGAASPSVTGPNATVNVPASAAPLANGVDSIYTPPAGTTVLTFTLNRISADAPTTLPIEITVPGCPVHKTFVGGGAKAF